VWAIEQWTALEAGRVNQQPIGQGLTPFRFVGGTSKYDLAQLNAAFFKRLRDFAQAAADRGMVVQLSLFDKHGLIMPSCEGRWLHSPYRNANNQPQTFLPNQLDGCESTVCRDPEPDEDCRKPRPEFIYWEDRPEVPIGVVHDAYIRRAAAEVGGIGNVMFEIANEVLPGDFGAAGEQWQIEVADRLRDALPDTIVRDAFNGDADGLTLNGKAPDLVAGVFWEAANAEIKSGQVGSRALLMGSIVSQTPDNQAGPTSMYGALPLDAKPGSDLSVRATVTSRWGITGVGLRDSSGIVATRLSADIWHASGAPNPELRLRLGLEGNVTTLATAPLAAGGNVQRDVRLTLDRDTQIVRVFVDGAETLVHALSGASFPSDVPLPVMHADFKGATNWNSPYTVSNGEVDNFEAATY
jgi:hypothetical protein